jgi:hypothetical protein
VRISKPVEGGVARAKFTYNLPGHEDLPDADPKFFFTAHSAWCKYKESGMLEVGLRRPELTEPKWLDAEGSAVEKGLVGETIRLSVSCNEDMEEGAGVLFGVYAEGADPKKDKPVAELMSENKNGKAEAGWKPIDTREEGDTTELRYFFTATSFRTPLVHSKTFRVSNPQVLEMKWEPQAVYYGDKVKLIIKTTELAEYALDITIKLIERQNNVYIHEEKIKGDKDEIEIPMEIEIAGEEIDKLHGKREVELFAEFICDIPIKVRNEIPLWMGIRRLFL